MKKRLSRRQYLPGATAAAIALVMSGCASSSSEPMTYQPPQPAPAQPAPAPRAEAAPVMEQAPAAPAPARNTTTAMASTGARPMNPGSGMGSAVIYFPTGQQPGSVLMVENMGPTEVQAGVPFTYTLKATNLSQYELRNTVVTQEVPGAYNIRTQKANVQPRGRNEAGLEVIDFLVGSLSPAGTQGDTRTIEVEALTNEEGILEVCTTAEYDMYVCWQTRAVRPNVTISKSGPAEVLLCDPINYTIVVENTGTGAAENIVVTDTLPNGLTSNGQRVITREIGTLGPGSRQEFTITANANATGTYNNEAELAGDGVEGVSNTVTTRVVQPVLEIEKTAPEADYLGARFDYAIKIANTGDAVATQTRLVDTLPSGVQFVSASGGGQQQGSEVVWNIGDLGIGEERSFTVTVQATERGIQRNTATVTATCAEAADDAALVELVGIPAVLLEVIDEVDPVKVGQNTTYVLQVTNQGSEAMTNLRLQAIMDRQSFVSISGPTSGTVEGELINITPLPSLAPGEKATWEIVVTAQEIGDIRFGVNMYGDQLTDAVRETEATNQYTEGSVRRTTPPQ